MLLGAIAFIGPGRSANAADSGSNHVRLHLDVDRTVLPAGSTETAIIKLGLDCARRRAAGFARP